MSEYITVIVENTDVPDRVRLITNQPLAPDAPEQYNNRAEGNVGSPLAQALFEIEGMVALQIEDNMLLVQRDPSVDWPILVDEITTALKDFFL
jgi:hypothetical protein